MLRWYFNTSGLHNRNVSKETSPSSSAQHAVDFDTFLGGVLLVKSLRDLTRMRNFCKTIKKSVSPVATTGKATPLTAAVPVGGDSVAQLVER